MTDFIGLLGKLLSNEPLERLMYMLIIFIVMFFFLPDGSAEFINNKVGIPYAFQVFIFAISFVLAINIQRFFAWCRSYYSEWTFKKGERQLEQHVNRIIDSLTENEKRILITALSCGHQVINETRNNPDIKSLIERGVLIPEQVQPLPHEFPYVTLYVSDIFWPHLVLRYDAYSGELK
ncbi:super-infection exclusion protein B [Hafnia alvei]|uniref:super-infection exclusion protein B n=1 Tax=Hafnia alvei TaxID=569 RepID=UPI001411B77A|nr:super-infection exclusion protein B [Hafnia alvei]QIP56856.1 hypothetical protein HBA19_15105 [Hafnia alvei]